MPDPALAPLQGQRSHPPSRALAGGALVVLLVAGLNKAVLFHNLEYCTSDLFSFLEMTWSWLYAGRLLHDNIFGYHGAIHNFYGMLVLAPLTLAFGAHGLFLAVVLAYVAAVAHVTSSGRLDPAGRLAILGGVLGPVAFYVFDDIEMGFHPELLYPPLAVLLAVELLDGWSWRSAAVSGAIVLVKEDGALVCAAVVVAHTVWGLVSLRDGTRKDAWRILRRGVVALAVFGVLFAAGMVLLAVMSDHYAAAQPTFSRRTERALRFTLRTLSGQGPPARWFRIRDALEIHAVMAGLTLLPLGRNLFKGLLLLAVAAPPLIAVLIVSSAVAQFNMMLWAPRIATVLAAVVAALVFAAAPLPGQRPRPRRVIWVLIGLSWAGQLAVLGHMQYPMASRWAGIVSLVRAPDPPLPPAEERFLRCVARQLPRGLPVTVPFHVRPVFHLQSIVFARGRRAWHPPRLRVLWLEEASPAWTEGFCGGPAVGAFAVEAECGLVDRVETCSAEGPNGPRGEAQFPGAPPGLLTQGVLERRLVDGLVQAARAPITPS